MDRYPSIQASITKLEEEGFLIYAFDASLGGKYPLSFVLCCLTQITALALLLCGAHPNFRWQ